MTDEVEPQIHLSREDLYELAWSKPIRELAKDFGISDVALAKRCRRLGIPVPGRGYWARVDAGQQHYRPKLPKRAPQWLDDGALTVAPLREPIATPQNSACADESKGSDGDLDRTWLQERVDFEYLPENAIEVPARTRKWDGTIQRCRDDLEKAAEELRESKKASDKYDKWPDWRKRQEIDSKAWAWQATRDRGRRLWDTHKAVSFRVSLDSYKRALTIMNALALAARARGFAVREDEERGRIVFAGHDAEIQLRITESLEQKTRPRKRYDGQIEQERYQVTTGRLRVTLQIGYREGPTFEDKESRPLESQLNDMFRGVYRLVVKAWRQHREQQALNRKWEEEEKQRVESARTKAELERALAKERARIERLSSEASRWVQSKQVRAYVDHIRASASEDLDAYKALGDWVSWALRVAEDLDPTKGRLHKVSRDSTTVPQG